MSYIHISDIKKEVGRNVSIRGWVHRKRSNGNIIFIVIRDHTGILQIAISNSNTDKDTWNRSENVSLESSIEVIGIVKEDKRSPTGYELKVSQLKIINNSEPYPITEYQSTELLLDKRHLWLRSTKMIPIMKARSYMFRYAREYLDKLGFFEITPPLITASAGESGSDMFVVDYFGRDVYLTESSQLYSEAMIYSLEKVYSFAPSFRAEKSRTIKHLTEFWHLEPEMAYYNMEETMCLIENLISHISKSLVKNNCEMLNSMNVNIDVLSSIHPPFKRITYEKSIQILNDKGKELKWGDDFGVEEEHFLTEDEDKPLFVVNWPRELKPFYMPINPEDERTVICADLQAPKGHGEIVGASERIWKVEEAMKRFKEIEKIKNIKFNMDNYSWYLDLIRYGGIPHSGFGMGMERLIKWFLNLDHIRDTIPFPRTINRISP